MKSNAARALSIVESVRRGVASASASNPTVIYLPPVTYRSYLWLERNKPAAAVTALSLELGVSHQRASRIIAAIEREGLGVYVPSPLGRRNFIAAPVPRYGLTGELHFEKRMEAAVGRGVMKGVVEELRRKAIREGTKVDGNGGDDLTRPAKALVHAYVDARNRFKDGQYRFDRSDWKIFRDAVEEMGHRRKRKDAVDPMDVSLFPDFVAFVAADSKAKGRGFPRVHMLKSGYYVGAFKQFLGEKVLDPTKIIDVMVRNDIPVTMAKSALEKLRDDRDPRAQKDADWSDDFVEPTLKRAVRILSRLFPAALPEGYEGLVKMKWKDAVARHAHLDSDRMAQARVRAEELEDAFYVFSAAQEAKRAEEDLIRRKAAVAKLKIELYGTPEQKRASFLAIGKRARK